MGTFADQIATWTRRTELSLVRYQVNVQQIAIAEMAQELSQRLPEVTPVDRGLLARSYVFELTEREVVVGSTAFYALSVKRHGHDLPALVVQEAEAIINDQSFLDRVSRLAVLLAR